MRPVVVPTSTLHPLDLRGARPSARANLPQTDPAASISADSISLLRHGKPWLPAMGEYHFSRDLPEHWDAELAKIKAGGISIVATYVFWIHHEERQRIWNWSGGRNLRGFAEACQRAGLPLVLRIGPWCHGEVRHGGLPGWLLPLGDRLRTDDAEYLGHVRGFYGQIAEQVRGLLDRDGGPVAGVQIENEYAGPGSHLLTLKRMAQEVGLIVPLYTRTAWPALASPLEDESELLPLHGAYAEGFWDRTLEPMPGRYWEAFTFQPAPASEGIFQGEGRVEGSHARLPYLTCELGGGMMPSYHRRVTIEPADIEALAICALGSGSNLPGYYMYHGGTNPGPELNETQGSEHTNHNDLPVLNYDFQAPTGAAGQAREHYHRLDRLHGFLRDFGAALTGMPAVLPAERPRGKNDAATLRWSVRTDGQSGFLFVNNHQRGPEMPAREAVQFALSLRDGSTLHIPHDPMTIPAGGSFILPFNLELAAGLTLTYATARLLSRDGHGGVTLAAVPGLAAWLSLNGLPPVQLSPGELHTVVAPGGEAITVRVISDADSLADGGGHGQLARGREPSVRCPIAQATARAASRAVSVSLHGLAAAPTDADFEDAAAFNVSLPPDSGGRVCRLSYTADVARVYGADGRLLADDFFHHRPLELRVPRGAAGLIIRLLPLPAGAPIYLSHGTPPAGVAILHAAELID